MPTLGRAGIPAAVALALPPCSPTANSLLRIVSACLVGAVYQTWGYAQGERLMSGAITQIIQYERRWLIKTIDGDCLSIVSFAPGGRRSLLHLTALFETAALAHSRWCLH